MSNSYFRFKQFTIHQDRCAMKVSTDACIQGAWTPVAANDDRILDIGTGTGLLALMLAQKNSTVVIDAIELDKDAAIQAGENVKASPWQDRIHIIHADAVCYQYGHKYSLIIANPPFFNNSLLGAKAQRNTARHTLTLNYRELFKVIKEGLADGGVASVLLPADHFHLWEDILAANNWQVIKQLNIHPRRGLTANRIVALCQPGTQLNTTVEQLYIKEPDNSYSTEFENLLSPYYLDK